MKEFAYEKICDNKYYLILREKENGLESYQYQISAISYYLKIFNSGNSGIKAWKDFLISFNVYIRQNGDRYYLDNKNDAQILVEKLNNYLFLSKLLDKKFIEILREEYTEKNL